MDESLRGIPLAALHNGEQFFVENYSYSVMPGLTLSDARYVPLKDAKLLMAGLSESPGFSLSSLPGVEVEISNLSVLWPDTKVLLNEDFNYENLTSIRRNEQHQVIHLATHGAYFPVQRNAEGEHRLAIGTDADRVPTLVLWDKVLVPQNISSQDWYTPPVDLLVLSTGGVGLGSADYEFGIAGSFLDAGVKSVIADIYLSNDLLYAQLMQEFYSNLQVAPIRAEALRRAQVSLINYLKDNNPSDVRNNSKGIGWELVDRETRNIEENVVLWGAGITIFGNPW
jgi:CHAT domain-containing protein